MPIPWLTVLQSVPWTDVIKNAPKVAEGAKKLLGRTSGKKPEPQVAVAELQAQLLDCSQLIKALAEQNAQLVARIEANRVRTLWLSAATGASLLLAVASLAVALAR
jgi:hypothetical protein